MKRMFVTGETGYDETKAFGVPDNVNERLAYLASRVPGLPFEKPIELHLDGDLLTVITYEPLVEVYRIRGNWGEKVR